MMRKCFRDFLAFKIDLRGNSIGIVNVMIAKQ